MSELIARAYHLGVRLRATGPRARRPGHRPSVAAVDPEGWSVSFPYGVVVTIGVPPSAEAAVLSAHASRIESPASNPEFEEARLRVTGEADGVEADAVLLTDLSPARLSVVAEVLARSVVLAHMEVEVGDTFDQIEPLAERLSTGKRPARGERELLRQSGQALATRTRVVGRVEVGERPEILWEHPELARLYDRLAAEYELGERDRALARKLELVSDLTGTLFDLIQARQTLRVEWYIVVLILVEIGLTLWTMAGG